ncbi:MAG: PqqD family protein [Caldisericum exile]|uniref:PqqD family protein n=1 Tax=Caldisericum exile TaxID=693075 RepID=UPI003C711228
MKEAKLVFKKENLLYEREEKEGYWTITSRLHPETRELIINPTAREILELADGSRTINEMVSDFISRYRDVAKEKIKVDMFKTLSSFTRLGIVEWVGDNPFLYRYEEPLNDGYSLSVAQEDNLRDIERFIKSMEDLSKVQEGIVSYKNPLIMQGEYSELVLRQKLFAFSEEFFLLRKDSKTKGMISISSPVHPKEFGATVKLVICPEKFLNDLFKYSRDYLPYLAVRDISKIEFYETNIEPVDSFLSDFILKAGFRKEAELKDEIGFGKDLTIYSLNYGKDFLDRVKEQRKKFI